MRSEVNRSGDLILLAMSDTRLRHSDSSTLATNTLMLPPSAVGTDAPPTIIIRVRAGGERDTSLASPR